MKEMNMEELELKEKKIDLKIEEEKRKSETKVELLKLEKEEIQRQKKKLSAASVEIKEGEIYISNIPTSRKMQQVTILVVEKIEDNDISYMRYTIQDNSRGYAWELFSRSQARENSPTVTLARWSLKREDFIDIVKVDKLLGGFHKITEKEDQETVIRNLSGIAVNLTEIKKILRKFSKI